MKIGAISLGCDKNRVDTEKMLARLVSGGHTLVGNEEDADVIIVNTCAFTDDAKSEAIDEILSAVGHKKHSKKKKIIVTGCLPQRYMETLEKEFPEVDAFLGIADYDNIVDTVEKITKGDKIFGGACGDEFTIWSGNDDLITPVMSLGGLGVISVLSNVLPVETQALCKAALNGDFDTAAALQLKMQPLIEALFSEVNPIPVKEAMRIIGFDCGPTRLPLTRVSEETQKKLQSILN